MNPYSDNSRTPAQKERDWYETIGTLHFAFYGPKLHVPTMSDFRLQDPSKPSKSSDVCPTVGDTMQNSTIYGHCDPCWKNQAHAVPQIAGYPQTADCWGWFACGKAE